MCTLCQARDPFNQNHDTHAGDTLETGGVEGTYTDTGAAGAKPFFTNDQVADFLTNGFWESTGRSERKFNVETGGTITYNINGLDAEGKATALQAMESWTALSGLQFQAASTADITFDDNRSGAYNSSTTMGSQIISSRINVDDAWQAYGDYYLQTYIHEIGHAIGLGHTGNYNGSASYSRDAHFANDSWQVSIMSYFSQRENTATDASHVYLMTAQLGDIQAVQNLYGTATTVRTGDTVYGDGENTGQFGMDLPSRKAVAILDNGGTDHINLASRTSDQRLDLNDETYSDLNGSVGNFSIARGTMIENATTGSGIDTIIGNEVANILSSGAGDDTLFGGAGDDVLTAGLGADTLTGGAGADRFTYAALAEGGDTITDFSLSDGDRVDITALLTDAGYTGSDPVGDGVVTLQAGSGGSWLMVDADGSGGNAAVPIAFLTGIDAGASVGDIIGVDGGGDGPIEPEPPVVPEDPEPPVVPEDPEPPVVPVDPDPPVEPEPPVDPEPPVEPEPTSGVDTLYAFTNTYRDTWTRDLAPLNDTDGGIDTIDASEVTSGVRIYLDSSRIGKLAGKKFDIAEDTVIENLILGDSSDTGVGNAVSNVLDGGAGSDKLYGREGNDELIGGDGNDRIYGGQGVDTVVGGQGSDRIYGNLGDDTLSGGEGKDRIEGGAGNDTINAGLGDDNVMAGDGDDTVNLGTGRDRFDGGAGDDTVYGGADRDNMRGGDGDDVMHGDAGADSMDGGKGNDEIYGGVDADRVRGDEGDDLIDGGTGADRLYGELGNDLITGGDDADRLYGGKGNDTVSGNDGDDQVFGDLGADVLDGGEGNDALYGGSDDDTLFGRSGNDRLMSGDGDDRLEAGGGDDRLDGDRGNDILFGGTGQDEIAGGSDADELFGGSGQDELDGGSGTDLLEGGSGDDELDGGTGDDVLIGGRGNDVMKGGSGEDTFVFDDLADGFDLITDFSLRQDTLDISMILETLGTNLTDAIADGVVQLADLGRNSVVQIDADGAAGTEFAAVDLVRLNRIDGDTALDATWLM